MNQRTVIVVKHPPDPLWDALCERTCDLAAYLDDIESAELKSREATSEGLIRCVHTWRAGIDVPPVLAAHIDSDVLEWTARTEWRAGQYESRWTIEPEFMNGSALCEAMLRFSPAIGGRGTRLGLELDIVGIERSVGYRTITSAFLTTHFRKLVDAAASLIEKGR